VNEHKTLKEAPKPAKTTRNCCCQATHNTHPMDGHGNHASTARHALPGAFEEFEDFVVMRGHWGAVLVPPGAHWKDGTRQ
jgi:hypothetical protein